MSKRLAAIAAVLILALAGCRKANIPPYSEAEELKFRTDEAKGLADPHGDLAFFRTVALKETVSTFGSGAQNTVVLPHWGSDPVELKKQGDTVIILNSPRDTTLDGKPVTSHMSVPVSDNEPLHWLSSGSVSIRIFHRDNDLAAQVFDGQSAALKAFHPLRWYSPASQYRVAAEWNPLPVGRSLLMHRTNGGPDLKQSAAGYIEFSMGGQPRRLYALIYSQLIFIVFRDLTSKTETYPSGRFLEVEFASSAFDPAHKFDPAKRTKMALDFNQAINPACAYNPNTKCPIAPPENRLPFAIPAGEKRYSF